jgi:hypothetical protein
LRESEFSRTLTSGEIFDIQSRARLEL